MPEKVIQAHSLEGTKEEWARKLNILPENITLEVIDKPSFFSRQWTVRLSWQDKTQAPVLNPSQAIWNGTNYLISPGEGVKQIIPYAKAGEVWYNGVLQNKSFQVSLGEQVEFHPLIQAGQLTWELNLRFQGLSVAAKVKHELPGRYSLAPVIPGMEVLDLAQYVGWENLPAQGEIWDEARLKADLEQLKVVHGLRQGIWEEIMAVEGVGEVVLAEATLPVAPIHARIEDFVGQAQVLYGAEEQTIDFFASKVKLVEEGAVLARKIPGRPGIPGKDVLGKVLPSATEKDLKFNLKKNVYLSDDGLEVVAACAGQPIRLDERTYMVENVYLMDKDVDLATGSIEFPGDVFVNGNVQDGLHIFAGGKLEIKGSVSHAELRAEKGARIHQNLLGGKVLVGEKFVVRSELLRLISDLRDRLKVCLQRTGELMKSPGAVNLKPGQCLKLIMEKQFSDLPKLSKCVEKFVLDNKEDEMITEGLIVSVRTAKHFLGGLGPLEPNAIPLLQRVNQALEQFAESLTVEIPEKLSFIVSYVQGTSIECGGSFECQKGTYNSVIRVEGNVTINGVCRGGKIFAGGIVKIRELGGSEVSSTFVQISSGGRLYVDYCHSNVIISVGREIVRIEEDYRNVEIYRENGRVQFEKIRVNPL
ncbi:FapA family protein [Desulfosporosinus youngiae]|uniref:Putative polymerase with PALM domain, HD hydrolase domain and Zn ribbon n=1 Tax=Desulfosporosinus youngiae DSM 17734 TaxID=768710 RepID=H5XYM1_9FIRM|nr:FapA family protein [Desulfosporosinus youngiae]EHQ91577.1 putative polymerase with PALM domain, HD hydrolase domain and Zn ribbon [Desulfosporosinus youngiae DSM 17734]